MFHRELILNLLVCLLRFANIFFLTSVPLLAQENKTLLQATPLVGLSSMCIIFLCLLSGWVRRKLLTLILDIVSITGIFLILLFCGIPFPHYVNSLASYVVFATLLGISLSGTEMLGLYMALANSEKAILRGNLALFNALKVAGYAMGFFFGTLVGGTGEGLLAANIGIGILASSIVALALYTKYRFRADEALAENIAGESLSDPLAGGFDAFWPAIRRSWTYCVYIILDVGVFAFWYVYIPYRLHTVAGIPAGVVGLWLSLQAFVHALCQFAWKAILSRHGEIIGYWLSLGLHIGIVFIITHVAPQNIFLMTFLFIVMGCVNSGTYIAAGILFHLTANLHSKVQSAATQQIASGAGKFLGTVLVNRVVI